jgi:hypothetical protein
MSVDTDAPTWSLTELAAAIAAELGEGWTHDPQDRHYSYLRGPNRVSLHLRRPTYPPKDAARLEISGSYPHRPGQPYRSPRDYGLVERNGAEPSISVAGAKGAAAIAKEIRRRLPLAEVERITAGILARHAQDADHEQLTTRNAEQLARALDGRVSEQGDGYSRTVYGAHGIYARVCGDSITWDRLTTTLAVALELSAVVMRHPTGEA